MVIGVLFHRCVQPVLVTGRSFAAALNAAMRARHCDADPGGRLGCEGRAPPSLFRKDGNDQVCSIAQRCDRGVGLVAGGVTFAAGTAEATESTCYYQGKPGLRTVRRVSGMVGKRL